MVGGAQGGANHRAPGREVTYRGGDPIEILRVLRPHQRCAAPWARNGSGGYPRWCFNFPDRPRRMGAEALPADRLEMRSRRRSAAVREDRRRRRSALQASRAISVRPNHVNGTGPRALLDRSRDAFATKAGHGYLLVEASRWSSAKRPQTTQGAHGRRAFRIVQVAPVPPAHQVARRVGTYGIACPVVSRANSPHRQHR